MTSMSLAPLLERHRLYLLPPIPSLEKGELVLESSLSVPESYTCEEVVNAGGFGKFQWKLTFLSCFAWMAESCELMVLSLLGRFLACEWKITSFQIALLTSVVFLAMGVGSPIWGKTADKYGRKKVVIGTTGIIVLCGILTVLAPSIGWIFAFRGILGFFMHGVSGIMVLYMEYLPTKFRGKYTLFFFGFWGVGSILVTVIAMVVMTTKNSWRLVLFISVIPMVFFLILSKWCPESARYMLTHGKVKEAEDTIIKMAEENGISRPAGKLQIPSDNTERNSFISLIKEGKQLFFCLIYLWFSILFLYYGIVLLAPEVISHGGLPIKSVFFAWLLVETLGRRRLMFMFLCFYSVSVMMLLIDKVPPAIPHILLFVARGSIAGCEGVCVLYTNEIDQESAEDTNQSQEKDNTVRSSHPDLPDLKEEAVGIYLVVFDTQDEESL
ncbi:synaptic vesicle 2-related protein-like [Limulus polyphemus]|uniref:Synaptic vesicle 2-related protein-like n=1 Tax=Limulus polyphemus TaxID=6850 RepID=A0ABM1SSW3_LIMPO|nr:synaptic vesicle 2-related protein-like [Limulus polyphemus]